MRAETATLAIVLLLSIVAAALWIGLSVGG